MAEQKPSSAEILAKIRAQKQGAAAAPVAADPAPTPSAEPSVSAVAPVEAAPKPAALKATPVGKPGSPADILAAIRAQAAGVKSGVAAPAAASAPKVAAAPKAAAVASDGPKLSVEEMLKAVRGEAAIEATGITYNV